jgi:DsbC/DsbD-like thiol-disulfide interchange protein
VTDPDFPVPDRMVEPGDLISIGYKKPFLLRYRIQPAAPVDGEDALATVEIPLLVIWQVCKTTCIYGESRTSLKLTRGDKPITDKEGSAMLARWKDRYPVEAAGARGRKGNIEAVKQHFAAGANVSARDWQNKTPLQHAAYWGHKEIAELLIAKGADVNAKDNAGTTTLEWAVSGGKKESVEVLIVSGVDVNAKSNYGTPLDVAIKYKKTEIADLLRKHGGKTGEELKAEGN